MRACECEPGGWLRTTGEHMQGTNSCPSARTPAGWLYGSRPPAGEGRDLAPIPPSGLPSPRRHKEAPGHMAHSSEEQSSPSADAGRHMAPSPITQPVVKTTTRVLTLKYKIGFTIEKQSMLFTVFTNQKSKTIQSTQQAQKVLDKIQHPFLRKSANLG